MSGKGSKPRPLSVDQGTYASNWDAIFSKSTGRSSTAEQAALTGSVVGSNPTAPANMVHVGDYQGTPVYADAPGAPERLYQVYVDNETGAQVTEEWWPGDPV